MTAKVALDGIGIIYPCWPPYVGSALGSAGLNVNTGYLDASEEKMVVMGRIYIPGQATSKTLSSAGGKIRVLPYTSPTWATSGSTLRIGLQDPDTTTGPVGRPDGTFDVYGDIVQGTDAMPSDAPLVVTMSSGSKTLSHGDLVAVVVDFVTRNGSDQVRFTGRNHARTGIGYPGGSKYTAGSWTREDYVLTHLIEFDDGTFGIIDGGLPDDTRTDYATVDNNDNPDEYGLIFQLPFPCDVNGLMCGIVPKGASADLTFKLYETPLGTPNALVTQTSFGEMMGYTGDSGQGFFPLAKTALKAHTDYCLAVKNNGTSDDIWLHRVSIAHADHRIVTPWGTRSRQGTRNNDSGAFAEDSTYLPLLAVRICGVGQLPLANAYLGLG